MKKLLLFILFLVLTVVTQIGGFALILARITSKKIKRSWSFIPLFAGWYLFLSVVLTPPLAKIFGREKITVNDNLTPTSVWTVVLNRNYVTPKLNEALQDIANDLPGDLQLSYLDACFPFVNGFPLLPHLSHNDGKKIDISFMYVTPENVATNLKPSRSGYGVFEVPRENELDQNTRCKSQGYWQYDYSKYLTFGTPHDDLKFSNERTKTLLISILNHPNIEKIFIEPHLKNRLNLQSQKVRFHGCRAVRHDDHIHIQTN